MKYEHYLKPPLRQEKRNFQKTRNVKAAQIPEHAAQALAGKTKGQVVVVPINMVIIARASRRGLAPSPVPSSLLQDFFFFTIYIDFLLF